MNEELFYQTILQKSKELHINPLLLISGIEGLYTFRDVPLSGLNYGLLDSLILTIFALRVGDQFHKLAEENLSHSSDSIRMSAAQELRPLSEEEIEGSESLYFQSFAKMLNGKSTIRKYHEKAIEVAAVEIGKTQAYSGAESISPVILNICKNNLNGVIDLGMLFNASA